ncbi:MAG: homoserine dehydrogenase, partial [Blautia sp.]|nr:homoserine dehydrogenase [Blautia sp.]
AREHTCSYLFEAAVGGGIPLLRTLQQSLCQEDISSIEGILNGTTNYILTKMEHLGTPYGEALSQAQKLGYAERNPAADVEGHDTGRKIAILSSLASGKTVRYADIYTEGITEISNKDFLYARAAGYCIRLLGIYRKEEDGIQVLTAPFLVKEGHPLYAVEDVFNGVLLHGNMVDDVMFYGRGAGKLPSGSAVVSDVMHAAKSVGKTIPCTWNGSEVMTPKAHEDFVCRFLVRVAKEDEEKTKAAFGEKVEKCVELDSLPEECAFFTAPMSEAAFLSCVEGEKVLGRIRVLE